MEVVGVIHNAYVEKKYFSMKINNKLVYFYLQNSLIKKFRKYLHEGRFVSFIANDEPRIIDNKKCYAIDHFVKIIRKSRTRQEIYYDIDMIRYGIKDFINSFDNVMFLDLEMTMQDYYPNAKFSPEIIQTGILICDKDKNELYNKSTYIKPTKTKKISKRTFKFLNINSDVFLDAITYEEFYNELSSIISKYNPYILVWGKNDILVINDSYNINNVEPLNLKFVNLLQLIKNYYNLKNDLGLFKALKMFKGIEFDQSHDALDDAIVTKEVFYAFRDVVNFKE